MGGDKAFSGGTGLGQPKYTPRLFRILQRLDDLVDWERRQRAGAAPGAMRLMRVSTKPAMDLLSRLSFPQHKFSAVHVSGSKGKGSVAALIAAGIRYRISPDIMVGTYGSPHVERVNERVRFNGVPISDNNLADALESVLDAREHKPTITTATWFDVMSSAGLLAFQKANIRWAVVEVGMGGRLDSTNVLSAPVGVITNIHLEHAEIIGPTRRDIAYEKAGIIAQNASVVCGLAPNDPLADVIKDEAEKKNATITFCPPKHNSTLFQQNLKMARYALQAVAKLEGVNEDPEWLLPNQIAVDAIANLPARQETFYAPSSKSESIQVVLDGAHVPSSVEQVLRELTPGKKTVIVLGVGKEKDVAGICNVIQDSTPCHVFATCAGPESPYLPSTELEEHLRKSGVPHISTVKDANEAVAYAIQHAAEHEAMVLVTGSLHLAGRVRSSLAQMCNRGVLFGHTDEAR